MKKYKSFYRATAAASFWNAIHAFSTSPTAFACWNNDEQGYVVALCSEGRVKKYYLPQRTDRGGLI